MLYKRFEISVGEVENWMNTEWKQYAYDSGKKIKMEINLRGTIRVIQDNTQEYIGQDIAEAVRIYNILLWEYYR
jgi:hypothetical protein